MKYLLLSVIALILLLTGFFTYRQYSALKSIDSYESCTTSLGSLIQTSYPATCVTRLGARFTQPVKPNPTPASVIGSGKIVGTTYIHENPNFSFAIPAGTQIITLEDGSIQLTDTLEINFMDVNTSYDKTVQYAEEYLRKPAVTKLTNGILLIGKSLDAGTVNHLAVLNTHPTTTTVNLRGSDKREISVFNQILSTFRFTDQ